MLLPAPGVYGNINGTGKVSKVDFNRDYLSQLDFIGPAALSHLKTFVTSPLSGVIE